MTCGRRSIDLDIASAETLPGSAYRDPARHEAERTRLEAALNRWRDSQLDRYRLPHPLIGLLTVREIVAWSLYHGRHHRALVRERLGGASRES